ncbi:MAG TPA: hypothetical protein VK147_12990 [Candidatus Didemnitutus sp.]|nr:hypothetical protein [Candidatus Didemnitutus sp.]
MNGYANTLTPAPVSAKGIPRTMRTGLSGLGFDFGSILKIGADLIPDSIQKTGQDVLDTVLAPAVEAAKAISPEAYAMLDKAAQEQIDKVRSEVGLPPVNPENAQGSSGAQTAPGTLPSRSSGSQPAAGSQAANGGAGSSKTVGQHIGRVANPFGLGGFVVAGGGMWWWTGRGQMKAKTGKRVALSLLVATLTGAATGYVGPLATAKW